MLKKLVFDVGGKEIELTEEEARQLHGELDRVFGALPRHEFIPVWPAYPNPQRWPEVTYETTTDKFFLNS